MNAEEILKSWNLDAQIDSSELGRAASSIPELHVKYWGYYVIAKRKLAEAKAAYKKLRFDKREFLINPTEEDVNVRCWSIPDRKILRTEQDQYLEGDEQLLKVELKVGERQLAVDLLQDILKEIPQRKWVIKAIHDDRLYKAGE